MAGIIAGVGLAVATILRLVSIWVSIRAGDDHLAIGYGVWVETASAGAVFGTVASVVGTIVAARQPRNAFGWLLVLGGAIQAVVAASTNVPAVVLGDARTDQGLFFAWLAGPLLHASILGLPAVGLLIFPDGRLPTKRWRAVAALVAIGMTGRFLDVAFTRSTIAVLPDLGNPYYLGDGTVLGLVARAGLPIGVIALLLAVASMIGRYRDADPTLRRQLLWFTWAGTVVAVTSVPLVAVLLTSEPAAWLGPAWATVFFLVLTLLPVAAGFAILRYRLYDIDRIVNRTIVYGSLTAILAGAFTAAVGLAQRVFVALTGETSDAAIVITTLVVATIYQPIRTWLETLVARRFKYEQPSFGPYREEIERVLAVIEPAHIAERLAREAVRELSAVGVAVLGANGSVTASSGRWPVAPVIRLPIRGGDGRLRTIALGPRADGAAHDPRRVTELEEIAALLGDAAGRRSSPPR
ncbi:MAG: hypothetical protein L0227_15035 [Chloroflexi bacterium]|nr:hypothetical protein [Chloroflexota bacterium]